MFTHLISAAIVSLLAQSAAPTDPMVTAYNRGAGWANGGISEQCLIEVAGPGKQHLLQDEDGRANVSARAQLLAGAYAESVRINDEILALIARASTEQRDRLERDYEAGVREVSRWMLESPSCNFFSLHQSSPTVERAKAKVAAQ